MVSTEHQHPLAAGWLAACGPAGAQGFAIGIHQDGGGSGLLLWSDNEPCVYREARFRGEIVVLCEQPSSVLVVRRRIGSGQQVRWGQGREGRAAVVGGAGAEAVAGAR